MTESTQKKKPRRADKDVVSYQGFTGLRNDVSPERFTAEDLAVASNVNIDKTGRVSRRAGYTLRNLAPAHSLWAQDNIGFFISGGALMQLNPDFSATPIALLANRTSYCKVNDRVYMTDGTSALMYDTGAIRKWGMDVPALPTTSLISGLLPAGRYQYTLTHLRADGQESGAPLAGAVDVPANMTIVFNVPVSADPAVVAKALWLTSPNGEVLFQAMVMPNALPTYTVALDDVLGLTLPLESQFLHPAPAGQLVAYYKGRMFVAVGDVLYMSEPYSYERFDLRNCVLLDSNITLLAVIEDLNGSPCGFFIGTDKSCGILVGSGPDTFQYVMRMEYGAVLGALCYVEGTLYDDGTTAARALPMWLTQQGICVGMPDMSITNLTRDTYTFPAATPGAAIFLPEENRAVFMSDRTTAMHTGTTAVSEYSNYPFNSFGCFNGTFLGASTQGVFELVGDDDNGVPIAASAATGITDFGTAYHKNVERLYLGYRSELPLELVVTTEETNTFVYPIPVLATDTLHGDRVKLGRGIEGRYWQFTVRNTAGGDFEIDMLDVKSVQRSRRVGA